LVDNAEWTREVKGEYKKPWPERRRRTATFCIKTGTSVGKTRVKSLKKTVGVVEERSTQIVKKKGVESGEQHDSACRPRTQLRENSTRKQSTAGRLRKQRRPGKRELKRRRRTLSQARNRRPYIGQREAGGKVHTYHSLLTGENS